MAENREYNSKDELINQIISEEYRMFSEVQNIGGRASCQDDYDTFYIMRCAQHNMLAWGRDPYDNQGGASIRLYFSGELKTWSEGTLLLACQDIISHLEKHENPVRMIYEKIMDFYSRVLM